MINPNIVYNVGNSVVWTITVTNSQAGNTNVVVNLQIPSEFTIDSVNHLVGTFENDVWTIGAMDSEEVVLIVTASLTTKPTNIVEELTFTADVTATFDTITVNNSLEDTVTYTENSTPLGLGAPDKFGTSFDLSLNDTPCSVGVSVWELDETIVNGTLVSFDTATGQGYVTHIDPNAPITGTYKLKCVVDELEYEVSCDVVWEVCELFSKEMSPVEDHNGYHDYLSVDAPIGFFTPNSPAGYSGTPLLGMTREVAYTDAVAHYFYNGSNWVLRKTVPICCSEKMEIESCSTELTLDLRVFLEGSYIDGTDTMKTDLNSILPSDQPYPSLIPFNNTTRCTKININENAVDWVLVKLRTVHNDPTSIVLTMPGMLLSDGTIEFCEDLLCNDTLGLDLTAPYEISIQHRNHLPISSPVMVSFVGNTLQYDFTTQDSLIIEFSPGVFLGDGQKLSLDGNYMMIGGNADQASGGSDLNTSDHQVTASELNQRGYLYGDVNMDGVVNSLDTTMVNSANGLTLIQF